MQSIETTEFESIRDARAYRKSGKEPFAGDKNRQTLHFFAQLDLSPGLQGKIDLSGIVQQTLLEAHLGYDQLKDKSENVTFAWLRRILANNLIDEIRKFEGQGRDIKLEQSFNHSSVRLEAILAADHTPPEERAMRNEELLQLAQAMLRLPSDQRFAVLRHHMQNQTLSEVAKEIGRSREAVAGLIHRGITKLRDHLIQIPTGSRILGEVQGRSIELERESGLDS